MRALAVTFLAACAAQRTEVVQCNRQTGNVDACTKSYCSVVRRILDHVFSARLHLRDHRVAALRWHAGARIGKLRALRRSQVCVRGMAQAVQ